jgi:hypothetical protein
LITTYIPSNGGNQDRTAQILAEIQGRFRCYMHATTTSPTSANATSQIMSGTHSRSLSAQQPTAMPRAPIHSHDEVINSTVCPFQLDTGTQCKARHTHTSNVARHTTPTQNRISGLTLNKLPSLFAYGIETNQLGCEAWPSEAISVRKETSRCPGLCLSCVC